MKYIDAEKLIAEIERRIKVIKPQKGQGIILCEQLTKQLQDLLSFIKSLQQEQSKVNLEKDKCLGCNNVKGCVTCVDGNQWAHISEVGVDFETEYAKFSNDLDALDYAFPIDLADYKDFARHFYELGLKARKEDTK